MSFITLDLFYKHFLKYSESFNINIQILRVYVLLVICNFFFKFNNNSYFFYSKCDFKKLVFTIFIGILLF